jgi:4-alpha-glucanotransferase
LPEPRCLVQKQNSSWLDDYALFSALSERYPDAAWSRWTAEIQQRRPEVLARLRAELEEVLEDKKIAQYFFYQQWNRLKPTCGKKGS